MTIENEGSGLAFTNMAGNWCGNIYDPGSSATIDRPLRRTLQRLVRYSSIQISHAK